MLRDAEDPDAPWMGEQSNDAMTCGLCDWWVPIIFDGVPVDEWVWKGAAVLHGLFLHPAEHHAATGHIAEARLAMYEREMGGIFDTVKSLALGAHLEVA